MVSEFEKVILFPQALVYVFNQSTSIEKLILIVGPIWILNMIYGLIISPLICHFFIVPRIEKKVGRKLGYSPLLRYAIFGKFLDRDIEISTYIISRYKAWKKYGEQDYLLVIISLH